MSTKKNVQSQNKSQFLPASNLKVGTMVLVPNFIIQKKISKKLQSI